MYFFRLRIPYHSLLHIYVNVKDFSINIEDLATVEKKYNHFELSLET